MIGVIGLSHKTASVEIRERFYFNELDIISFIDSLKNDKKYGTFVVLSTCNRTEVYFHLPKNNRTYNFNSVLRKFIEFWKVDDDVKKYFYTFHDINAVKHLFKVVSGLDAMALGEDQILGQVKDAYRISASVKFTGSVLDRLFHKAFEVGKRVRTETAINEGAASISYAGVELAGKIFNGLENCTVLLIGTGETGVLVLKNLKKKGCKNIFISNRTFEQAEIEAKKYDGKAIRINELMNNIAECDIIIASTGSKKHLIDKYHVNKIMERRKGRPVFFIDLSVPRNIDVEVKEIENVYLYDIDDLEEVIANNYVKREKEITKAVMIIDEMTNEFSDWLSTLKITPTIQSLKEKFENINKSELDIIKRKLSSDEFEKVSIYGDYITGKLARLVINNLISLSKNGNSSDYTNIVNNLFELQKTDGEQNN